MTEINPKQKALNAVLQQMSNSYWSIANNIIKEIQKRIPEFTRFNPETGHIFEAWDLYVNNPDENTFQSFIVKLQSYGADSRWN